MRDRISSLNDGIDELRHKSILLNDLGVALSFCAKTFPEIRGKYSEISEIIEKKLTDLGVERNILEAEKYKIQSSCDHQWKTAHIGSYCTKCSMTDWEN